VAAEIRQAMGAAQGTPPALQPPNGDGAYDATVVYYCR